MPRERLRALAKATKWLDALKEATGVEFRVSEEGIAVEGEASKEWLADQALSAIALGFEPRDALRLLQEDVYIEVVDLSDLVRSKRAVARQLARIIGTRGRAKARISELSGAALAVSGKKVAIIGKAHEVALAKAAVERLARGAMHGAVYNWLERQRAALRA